MNAIEIIAAEYERIISPEFLGETPARQESEFELAWLACAFAIPEAERQMYMPALSELCERIAPIKNKKSRLQQLVAAGALIAAEIERVLAEEKESLEP